MNRKHACCRLRRSDGFTLVEIMIALVFLSLATGLTLRLYQTQLDRDRLFMDRLRRQLMLENVAERLSVTPYDQLADAAASMTKESDVEIELNAFEAGKSPGLHMTLSNKSTSGMLRYHVWRLEGQQE